LLFIPHHAIAADTTYQVRLFSEWLRTGPCGVLAPVVVQERCCRRVQIRVSAIYVNPAHCSAHVWLYLALECFEIGQTGMTSDLACEVLLLACQECMIGRYCETKIEPGYSSQVYDVSASHPVLPPCYPKSTAYLCRYCSYVAKTSPVIFMTQICIQSSVYSCGPATWVSLLLHHHGVLAVAHRVQWVCACRGPRPG